MRLHGYLPVMLFANLFLFAWSAVAEQSSGFLPKESAIKLARDAISAELKDPYSVKFEGLDERVVLNARGEPTQVVCGTVNAKNSFGAYVGARPFVHLTKLRQFYMLEEEEYRIANLIIKRFCFGSRN